MTLSTKDSKIKAVYDFLSNDELPCLIIVGGGGSGKSMAVYEALSMLSIEDLNLFLWNEGELPYPVIFPVNAYNKDKWIICRLDWGEVTKGLADEWTDQCKTLYFERGMEQDCP